MYVSDMISSTTCMSAHLGIVMRKCIVAACETLSNHEAELNRLDSGGGDADCGSTHSAGAKGECDDG